MLPIYQNAIVVDISHIESFVINVKTVMVVCAYAESEELHVMEVRS